MPFPLVPVAIGAGALWLLSRSGGKRRAGAVAPSDVQTSVYNALAFEHDPNALLEYADQLDAQGYHSQAAVLRQHAKEIASSDPADQQSALLRRGVAALKAGGH